jgi:hypothetical protein
MNRRFSNAMLSLASAALKLCTETRQLLADSAVRSGISSRAALYARPWPEVARGPRASAQNAISELVSRSGGFAAHYSLLILGVVH